MTPAHSHVRLCGTAISSCLARMHTQIDALRPFEGLNASVQRQEEDADDKGHEDAGLLRLLSDEQHPPDDCQLATHLERLPQEHALLICGQTQGRL